MSGTKYRRLVVVTLTALSRLPMRPLSLPLRCRPGLLPTLSLAHWRSAARTTAFAPTRIPQQRLPRRLLTMNAQDLAQYLADAPPTIVRLEIEKHFDALTDKQKRYAHYISK